MIALINFDCPHCGQNIDADEIMRGISFPCPACDREFSVPGEPEAEPALPVAATRPDTGQTTLRKRCHSCGGLCDTETVICVNCGYNFTTREVVGTQLDEPPEDDDEPEDAHDDSDDFQEINEVSDYLDAAESQLGKVCFFLNEKGVFEPPIGKRNPQQAEFLEQLNHGRAQALELRKEHKRIQPLSEQDFDPLDNPLPNYHSLGILFDRDHMGDDFGWPMLLAFLRRVKPSGLRKKVVLHAGSLLGFQNLCAIVARGQMAKDLEYIARQFDVEFEPDWLLPYSLRFLRSDKSDGHRLQRTFCIPIELILEDGVLYADRRGVIGGTITADCVAGLPWRLPEWVSESE